MPSTKKHSRRRSDAVVSPGMLGYLRTGEYPADDDALFDVLAAGDAARRAAWREMAEREVERWAVSAPGTRPWAWWRFDAPEPRRRLGGIGTPSHECLNYVPEFAYGIPTLWITAFDEAYFQGLARNIHGRPIGQEFAGQVFAGRAIDPDDPPRFEGEAAYLERLGLWVPGEKRRAPAEAFDDEIVRPDEE